MGFFGSRWRPGDGGPLDEYDWLVGPVATLIGKNADRNQLKEYIEKKLNGHFGLKGHYLQHSLEKTLDKLITLF